MNTSYFELPLNTDEEIASVSLELLFLTEEQQEEESEEDDHDDSLDDEEHAQDTIFDQIEFGFEDRSGFSSLQHYLAEIGKIPLLTRVEEIDLARRIACNDERARRMLILANLRLVVSIAKNYQRGSIALMDLVEEGNLGLIHAVQKFKPEYGCRFSTYATAWIKQAILRSLSEQGRMIRIPLHMVELIKKYFRANRKLRMKLSRDPNNAEIAEKIGVSLRQVEFIASMLKGVTSMDQALGDDSAAELHESIPDESIIYPDDLLERKMKTTALMNVLDSLPEQERMILQYRFGFTDGTPRTLAEIGTEMNLSRERIRQIEQKAIARLRHRMTYNSNEFFYT